jgi:hypothetical protein
LVVKKKFEKTSLKKEKMAPPKTSKKQQSDMKKAEERKKDKILEDKNFGVKNKNKSKKVQQVIQAQKNPGGLSKEQKKEQELKEQKRLEKLAERERERELQALFKSVDVKKDQTDENQPTTLEELEEDIDQEIKDESEMTLEEIVEKERGKIIGGTKVTEETFAQWKDFKLKQKKKEEDRKKKTAVKSGRELFEQNAKIFVDDDEAADVDDLKIVEDGMFDDDLFLEEDDVQIEKKVEFEIPEYDPDTWKDKLPKVLLLEALQKLNVDMPVFEFSMDGKLQICSVNIPHLNREFTNKKGYKQKKVAENNAALYALTFIEKTKKVEKIEEKVEEKK